MHTIKGGFSTKDPDAKEKIMKAIGRENSGLNFTATNWKSTHHSELVKGEKEVSKVEVKTKKV